jgi:hypothetical protein
MHVLYENVAAASKTFHKPFFDSTETLELTVGTEKVQTNFGLSATTQTTSNPRTVSRTALFASRLGLLLLHQIS